MFTNDKMWNFAQYRPSKYRVRGTQLTLRAVCTSPKQFGGKEGKHTISHVLACNCELRVRDLRFTLGMVSRIDLTP